MLRNSKFFYCVKYSTLAFASIGILMSLFEFVQINGIGYTGLQAIFGKSKFISFSFAGMLSIILPLIGSLSIYANNRIVRIVGSLFMITGTVLCFCFPCLVVFAKSAVIPQLSLSYGAIISGVLFGIGSMCNIYSIFEK